MQLRKVVFSVTGDKVLIVIGGDDSYKDEDEEENILTVQ